MQPKQHQAMKKIKKIRRLEREVMDLKERVFRCEETEILILNTILNHLYKQPDENEQHEE